MREPQQRERESTLRAREITSAITCLPAPAIIGLGRRFVLLLFLLCVSNAGLWIRIRGFLVVFGPVPYVKERPGPDLGRIWTRIRQKSDPD